MGDRKMGHVQSFKIYAGVFGSLLALTVITVLVSLYDFSEHWGESWEFMNTVVAVGVAGVKASLVVLFFMHGKYEGKITWAFIWYPLVILGILIAALFLDYGYRNNPENYLVKPTSITLEHHGESHGSGDHGDSHGAADTHGKTDDHGDGHDAASGEHDAATGDHAAEKKKEGDHAEEKKEGDGDH